VGVLLTAPWHARDTSAVVDRYAASVWGPPGARWEGPALTTTDDLPPGVEALLPGGDKNQALFFVRDHQTLVTGDIFSGTGGRFHVFLDEQDPALFLEDMERSEEHTSELQSRGHLVCRLLLEKKKVTPNK